MSKYILRYVVLLGICAGGWAEEATAQTMDFYPSADTFILNNNAANNNNKNGGGNELILAGPNSTTAGNVYRSLVRFDLSSLNGEYDSITSATLTFTHSATTKLAANQQIVLNLFLLDTANKDWVEGTQVYGIESNSACWNYLAYDEVSPVDWAGGAGIGNSTASAGISNLAAVSSITITNNDVSVGDTVSFTLSGDALAAVDSWAGGGDNAGFFIATDEVDSFRNAVMFASSDDATVSYRPKLSINYTVPSGVMSFSPSDDNFVYNTGDFTNQNFGVYPQIVAGLNHNDGSRIYRGLLRFDLSALQGQSDSIDKATLTFVHDDTAKLSSNSNNTFEANLLLLNPANKEWIEGTGNPNIALTNESAWNCKTYPDGEWTGGAGVGNSTNSAGIDAVAASVIIVPTEISEGDHLVFTFNADGIAALKAWAEGGDNAGFLLATDEISAGVRNALVLASKENGMYAAPVLKVYVNQGYGGWAAGYGLSSGTETNDADGDGLSNLAEYGLGGNPTNGIDQGYAMETGLLEQAGTNSFQMIYARRTTPGNGLTYTLEQCDDLVIGNWTNSGSYVETSGSLNDDFDSVTNRFPTEGKVREFVRLLIGN